MISRFFASRCNSLLLVARRPTGRLVVDETHASPGGTDHGPHVAIWRGLFLQPDLDVLTGLSDYPFLTMMRARLGWLDLSQGQSRGSDRDRNERRL